MSLKTARTFLPNVGDVLFKQPVIFGYGSLEERVPKKCVVTYVNHAHLWYEVQFTESGFRQCYKAIEGVEEQNGEASN